MKNLEYHIVAHFLFTGTALIRNGKITFDASGNILNIQQINLIHAESARTKFISGMVLPLICEGTNEMENLANVALKNIHPFTVKSINTLGLTINNIKDYLLQIQNNHQLYNEDFLELWNKISLHTATSMNKNGIIEPGNKTPLISLHGAEWNSFRLKAETEIRLLTI